MHCSLLPPIDGSKATEIMSIPAVSGVGCVFVCVGCTHQTDEVCTVASKHKTINQIHHRGMGGNHFLTVFNSFNRK